MDPYGVGRRLLDGYEDQKQTIARSGIFRLQHLLPVCSRASGREGSKDQGGTHG